MAPWSPSGSFAANLGPGDTNPRFDVHVKDLNSASLVLVSATVDATVGNGNSVLRSISANGTRVAFQSGATNLDPADRDRVADIYLKDLSTGAIALASTGPGGDKSNGASATPILAGNGVRVVFTSLASNLTADSDGLRDVYVKAITG